MSWYRQLSCESMKIENYASVFIRIFFIKHIFNTFLSMPTINVWQCLHEIYMKLRNRSLFMTVGGLAKKGVGQDIFFTEKGGAT